MSAPTPITPDALVSGLQFSSQAEALQAFKAFCAERNLTLTQTRDKDGSLGIEITGDFVAASIVSCLPPLQAIDLTRRAHLSFDAVNFLEWYGYYQELDRWNRR